MFNAVFFVAVGNHPILPGLHQTLQSNLTDVDKRSNFLIIKASTSYIQLKQKSTIRTEQELECSYMAVLFVKC